MKPVHHLLAYRKLKRFTPEWREARKPFLDYVLKHIREGRSYQEIGASLGLSDSAIAEYAYKHVYQPGERRIYPKGWRPTPDRPAKVGISLPYIPPPRS
jgi:hypothetical protein